MKANMRVSSGSYIAPVSLTTPLQELIETLQKFKETRYVLTTDQKIVLIELVREICR